jgi:hypothetical protein
MIVGDIVEEPSTNLDVLKREVVDVSDTVKVPLGPDGDMVEVLCSGSWRSSAMDAQAEGRYGEWARKCLVGDGYQLWLDIDPTGREIVEFFDAFGDAGGITPLASRASQHSSRRDRRR